MTRAKCLSDHVWRIAPYPLSALAVRVTGYETLTSNPENWGSVSLTEAATDILKLTKLNWNTAAFNCREPITLAFARRVGDILKLAKAKEPALHYRYYV